MKESQTTQLYNLLKSGMPVRTDEIAERIYGGGSLARVGARINDLAVGNWPGKIKCVFIDERGNVLGTTKGERKGWPDRTNKKLYWYRLRVPGAYSGTLVAFEPKERQPAPVMPPAFAPKEKVEAHQVPLF